MSKNKRRDIQQNIQVKHIPDTKTRISKQQLFLLFCLLVAVFIAYLPSLNKEFINLDDNTFIIQNPYIANFSLSKIPANFSHFHRGQYAPVPSVACGFINMIVGFKPFLYNVIAVILHLFTILLVFKLIWSLCSNFRIAFVTAALFGIATMQVESVAWLAAVYKTCLYSIFFLSSLILYVKYIKTNKRKYIFLSLLLYLISCLCREEQAVALSLAVVAIDIFLGRKLFSKKIIIEKLPFFFISVVFGLLTMVAARTYAEQLNITSFSIFDRVIYASYALCSYIYKLFIPLKLSLYYPYFPLDNSRLLYMVYPLMLLILSGLFVYSIKKGKKYIIFGGLFFLLNILFPMALQIISIRPTIMADRYVYLASIGIFFIVAKGIDLLIEKKLVKPPVIAVFFAAFFLCTSYFTYGRTETWKNSLTVWNDVISKYQNISYAYYFRANERKEKGDLKGALDDYDKTLAIRPNYAEALYNRGVLKMDIRDKQGALDDFNKAIKVRPNYAEAYINRGNIKGNMGDKNGAIEDYSKSIALFPSYMAYCNRGNIKLKMGDKAGALEDFDKAIAIGANNYLAYYNRGNLRLNMGDKPGAIEDFEKSISINPKSAEAYNNKGSVMVSMGKSKDAIINFDKAIEINPNYLNAYVNRAIAKYNIKDLNGAMNDCEKALSINPNDEKAQNLKLLVQQELQSNNH